MRKMVTHPKYWLLILCITLLSVKTYGQKCLILEEYPNEIKIRCAALIDSLRKSSVDTILFHGLGWGESGSMKYGKIYWYTKTGSFSAEVSYSQPITYSDLASREALQYYLDKHMDTVSTNPQELKWASHDLIHYVFAAVANTSTCFTAENYLLNDTTHLRSKWVELLNKTVGKL